MITSTELENIKVGDVVLLTGFGFGRDKSNAGRVDRLTKTMIIVKVRESEYRFNRSSGYQVGKDSWTSLTLDIATPEKLDAVKRSQRHDKLQRLMRDTQWGKMSLETLELVAKLVYPPSERDETE
jgi:hypothetical protein